MWKNLLYYMIVQVGSCIAFLFSDFVSEEYNDDGLMTAVFFVTPVLAGILFCVFEKFLRGQFKHIRRRWVHCLAAVGLWAIECTVFGLIMIGLMEIDFIEQGGGFLNGLEYYIFPFFLFGGAVFIMALGIFGMWIFEHWQQKHLRQRLP